MSEEIEIRVFGEATLPTLIYLPGMHGDWTLIPAFRTALQSRARFVEVTYPRTVTWTMQDYGRAINDGLEKAGIASGWLLAESFGSQLAWELIRESRFQVEGLILAAGFVKHPLKLGPGILRRVGQCVPMGVYWAMMNAQSLSLRMQHWRLPEAVAAAREFVARRTALDREAMRHRLALLDGYDPRNVARETKVPVYYLAGAFDPLVPWPLVRRWLRKHCPGYRGGRTVWLAHHNVLAVAPATCARFVLGWMAQGQREQSNARKGREAADLATGT
jgi:pimeloyl-ACP methyl ester carboxylesterase